MTQSVALLQITKGLETLFQIWCACPISPNKFADLENLASVQAMLADIFVDKCGHFYERQELTTKLSNCGAALDKFYIVINKCAEKS